MSATVAILFLVEAAIPCGTTAPARLAGGAEVVRAILDVEEQAPDPPAPTPTGWSQSTVDPPGGAELEANDPDDHPTQMRCEPATMPIA